MLMNEKDVKVGMNESVCSDSYNVSFFLFIPFISTFFIRYTLPMRPRIIVGNIFLGLYFWVTLGAVLLTMLRIWLPFPKSLIGYSYGMMAPYQSFETQNGEAYIEGRKSDGTWERIDLLPYYPVLTGERTVREITALFDKDPAAQSRKREILGKLILEKERKAGRQYSAVRLGWVAWPSSPFGFRAMQQPGVMNILPLEIIE